MGLCLKAGLTGQRVCRQTAPAYVVDTGHLMKSYDHFIHGEMIRMVVA
jgi:hypothetical protein